MLEVEGEGVSHLLYLHQFLLHLRDNHIQVNKGILNKVFLSLVQAPKANV